MKNLTLILSILLILIVASFFLFQNQAKKQDQPATLKKEAPTMAKQKGELKLTSPAFNDGETIPDKYTCSGEDVNPPLEIAGVPQEAQSLVLIVSDPDAPGGTWDHWLLFNINPEVSKIEENSIPSSALQGTTGFGKRIYGGPCPPPGPAHRYMFKLYALDTKLELEAGASKADLEQAMDNHILAQTQLAGLYSR